MESTATTTMAAKETAVSSIPSTMTNRTSPIVDTGQFCSVSQMSPIKGQAINFTIKSQAKETALVSTSAKDSISNAKTTIDTESVSSSLSDVENFTGKIVYNPDGSAYIIEGPDSEGSDVEAEISQEGSIIDARGMTPPYGRGNVVFPQVVSAFHISRSSAAALYSALYGQAYQNILQENKVPEVPVMHSYRVFNLRDNYKTNCEDQINATDLSGGGSLEKDNNNTIRSNYCESSAANSASSCQTVPVKPILMCFICKLSFGYSKSFIAHSIQEHNIALNDEEKRVLSNKNSSAIIQLVGKDKEPLLSFLEPKQRPPALNEMPAQFQQQLEAQQRLLASVAAAAALRQSSCSSSLTTSADNKSSVATSGCNMAKTVLASAGTLVSSVISPVTSTVDIKQCESQSHSSALSFVLPKNGDDTQRQYEHSNTTPTSRETPEADSSFGPELADLANLEKIAKAAAAAAQQQQIEQTSQMVATHQLLTQRSPSPSKQFLQSAPSPKSPIASTTPSLSQYHSSPSPTNASPFMCSAHPDGKTNGVECPKCDLILGSSRSLGGHMTMMHSRNSCKTLKCPKCNWHYKYQETLEIHMKEKHPENEMNCIYCLANQPHPRLARGETYTCGYKPYRCEVCNYSTTTKGNLSIHMQSDKHINNVQELQNGNIPAEHLLQSQALAAAVAASATGVQSTTSSVPTTTTTASSNATSPAPTTPVIAPPKTQQVTPSSGGAQSGATSKQKATWRCDVCNYETNVARNLRIHMTSEKHTHNLMVLKQNVSHMQQLSALQQAGMITPEQLFQFHPGIFAAAAGLATGQPGGPQDNLQPEAALADMAYNHALLMMASQQQQQRAIMGAMIQQQQQQQQQSQPTTPGNKSPVARLSGVGSQPTYDIEHPDPSLGIHNVPYDDTCRLFQCCVCGIYSSDSIEGLSQHIQCDRTRQREDEVLMAVGGSYICKLCSYKTNLKANFQLHCKTDKHLQRLQHVNHIKEGGTQSEWKLKYVNVSNPVQVRCNVCDYYTNSIHKLQLHTANARHDACSRVFLHLQLAETLVNGAPNKYYYCALCAHPSRTKISLVQHINSIKHLRNESLRQLKQQQSGALGMKDSEEEIRELFQVKELTPNEKIVFESDNNSNDDISDSPPLGSAIESANDSMLKNALMEQHAVVAQMAAKMNSENNSGELHFCPYCNYSHTSEVRIQMHIVSTHSKQQRSSSTTPPNSNIISEQTMLCPLCQEGFKEKTKLETHLIEIHNVKQEGLQKLMLLVDTTEVINSKPVRHNSPNWSQNEDSLDSKSEQREIDTKSDCSGDSGSKICEDELFDSNALSESHVCPGCPKIFLTLDELFTHINSEGHLKLTELSPNSRTGSIGNSNSGYQCWKKGCGQAFKTISATQLHYKEQHSFKSRKISGAAVSDRHVYKYRCSQCSLAFKTIEKLQLHSQYHLIRAATQCVLCGRSFRSVEALQKHVESTHSEMSEEELEQYKSSLVNNPLLFSGRNGGGILDPSTTELLKKESNRLDDINNDEEAMDLVLTNTTPNLPEDADEEMTDLSENRDGLVANNQQTNSLEDFLNSQAVAEDSYNDPNRKYKCHRCKVAFTRQSYLTSHNKTLLHRKGEKLSYPMEKYLDPNRPYKCDICKESFTQKNILLVHYNSVSHLHKLKQTMKENNNQTSNQSSNTAINSSTNVLNTSVQNSCPSNESSVQSSTANNMSDLDKKPYRCNICKVAYNLGTTLDIHVRSVLHQTKASKLHDLALTGQIDLSVPLIERPDNTSETAVTATTPSTPNSNIPSATATSSPPKMAGDQNKPSPGTPSPSTTPKFQETLMSINLSDPQQVQQAAALQQAALNLAMSAGNNGHSLLLGSSPFQCQRCGSAFISHEAQVQHQQLCCLFSPPNNSAPNINKQSAINQQRSQSPQTNEQQSSGATAQSASQSISRTPKFSSYAPVCRSKPPLYKHLLETWGFEIVMQFNECHQKRVKKEVNQTDVKKETDLNLNANTSEAKDNTSADPNIDSVNKSETKEFESKKEDLKNNLPEINRSKCEKCSKEFSSIWVLKAHKEEIHKDVVPLEILETFADDYRSEYERKCALEEENDGSSDQNTTNLNESSQIAAGANIGPSNTPPLSMANNMVNNNSSAAQADMAAANQMAAHLQFSQLLMSMGLAGMGMPLGMNMNAMNMNMPFAAAAAMGLHPPLIPVMMAPHLDPMMAAAFNHPAAAAMVNQAPSTATAPSPMPTPDPNFFAAQQKLMQQQQQQLNAAQQQKRARTRISDEQLKVLRQYFDINNSPTEEQLLEMSEKSGLPMKVIKHWFRNTLFKERQRNKDSPYNFNNPPSTFLNLEEYEKTGETKILTLNDIKKENDIKDNAIESETNEKWTTNTAPDLKSSSSTKDTDYATSDDDMNDHKKKDLIIQKTEQQIQEKFENHILQLQKQQQQQIQQQIQLQQQQEFELTKAMLNASAQSPHTSESSMSSQSAAENSAASLFAGLPGFATSLAPPLGSGPLQMAIDAAHRSQMSGASNSNTPNRNVGEGNGNSNSGSSGKRANRTRFTDYQIKVLQEFFESNAYPKDDDLEYLSKLLNLSPRVIVVWFQNARQKARKVYENQPPVPQEDDGSGRFQRTPGLNYQCKKCMQVFQRYYELIKHQKSACFKDENPLAAQIRAAAESRAQSTSPGVSREAPSTTPTPIDSGRTSATPDKLVQQSPQPASASQSQSGQSSQQQQNAYRCDKCSLAFNRYDLWREHQLVHLMNPNLFPNYPPSSPFGILQYEAQQSPQTNASTSPNIVNSLNASLQLSSQQQPIKRKLPEDEDSHDFDSLSGGVGAPNEQPRDKRLRTTILPEQLDYLYQKYQIESNPSRKMLESIAKEVGLKKRVVQVWFQNTRARERKGQFRAHQQVIHKRCPFCRALFKARSALESHLATRHADQYTKGDINIDALPDGDPSDMTDTSSPPNANDDIMRNANVSGLTAEALQSTMKKYYEDSLKKYLEELNLPGKDGTVSSIPSDLSLKMKAAFEASGLSGESTPLDLSKPVDLSQPLRFSANDDEGFDDTRSDGDDSDSSDELEFDYYFSQESNPTSPAPGSTTSSTASAMNRISGSGPNTPSNSSKRFRTQMTTVMLKVMKSIFADYKTPSMAECECLGREVGLPKRVVQVWFQNARAKEKKARLAFAKTFGQELETNTKPIEECKICCIKYNLKFSSTSMQDHLFSKKHIENLKLHIDSVKKLIEGQDDNSSDFPIASGIVLPVIPTTGQNNTNSTSSETGDNRSKSATNLMQQLQLMGLSGALPAGFQLPDVTVNGGNTKNFNDSMSTKSTPEKTATTNLMTNNKDSNSSASSAGGGVGNAGDGGDNSGLFNYMYPGLQNYYANAGAAAAFLHPSMYGTAANSTVPSGSNGSAASGPNGGQNIAPISSGPLQPQETHQNFAQQQPQQQITQQSQQQQPTQTAQMSGHSSGGSFYADTSNMYGTPLSLLQLPPSILPEITTKLNQMGISNVRFMQDGRSIEELRPVISEYDFKMINESDVEVGFTCKKCHMTYPAEVLCLGHQRASCFAKQSSDIKATLKLVQIYIECRACREKFGSIFEYKFHCDCDRHRKRTQKLEMTNTNTTNTSNAITTNGQTITSNDITANSLADMTSLFMNGNDANLINYLTKNLNNSGVAFSNISDANH